MANLTLAIPRDAWEDLLLEVSRVLALGGRLEIVEDRVSFSPRSQSDDSGADDINENMLELERAYEREDERFQPVCGHEAEPTVSLMARERARGKRGSEIRRTR